MIETWDERMREGTREFGKRKRDCRLLRREYLCKMEEGAWLVLWVVMLTIGKKGRRVEDGAEKI